jgi:GR25 family glycosyltransferase involved in LPS biosynthesis
MRIAFIVIGNTERGGLINGDSIRYGGTGASGTDSTAILVAEYLARNGHDVVFAVEGKTDFQVCRGVKYTNLAFDSVENKEFDILVSCLWFCKYDELNIKVTKALIYWCHLAWMYGIREISDYAKKLNIPVGIVHVSAWEKGHNDSFVDFIKSNVGDVVQKIIPNAIMVDVIEEVRKENIQKIPKKTIFHAQWSRGGPTALDVVRRSGLGEENFISFDYLKTVAGRADKKALFRQLAESEYFIFPSFTHEKFVYKDTFSCAVAEALALGVIVVAYPLGALPEYYKDYCVWTDFPSGTDLEKLNKEKVSEMPEMGNTDNMSAEVVKLERDGERKKSLSLNSQRITEIFHIEKIGPMWQEFLQDLTKLKSNKEGLYETNHRFENSVLSIAEKTVYINLDSREDRRVQVQDELSKYGISAERFPAVCMSIEESNEMTRNGAATWDIKVLNMTQEELDRKLRAQRSCTKSHIEIIKKAKADGLKNILIFEDDVLFNDEIDLKLELSNCLSELRTKEWDLFVLGCNPRTPFKMEGNYLARLGGFYNAHAVLVNSTAYDAIIQFPFNVNIVIDQFYFSMSISNRFKVYTPKTPLAFQRDSFSDIEGRTYDTKYIQKDAYKTFLEK